MKTPGLALALVCAAAPSLWAESLVVRYDGDDLYVSAPELNLIQGDVAERLKNGSEVAFDFHLALWVGDRGSLRRRAFERFVVSYDLWEEKYSVAGLRKPLASVSRLAAGQVAAWCLERIALPSGGLARDIPFWVRLEIRPVEKKSDNAWNQDSAPSLTRLIELLSGSSRGEPNRWSLEAGPLRRSGLEAVSRP